MDLNRFDETMDMWAAAEDAAAESAKAAGDERARSIALMKKSMYSNMLRTLGRRVPGALERCAEELAKRREKQLELGDIDSADRIRIQIECIRRTQQLVVETGGEL